MQFGSERLDCVEKLIELCCTIAQPAGMSDRARQLAGKSEVRWSQLDPPTKDVSRWNAVEGGIDFDRGKVSRVKFEPVRFRQIRWIKGGAPVGIIPGAGPDPNFLLLVEVQVAKPSLEPIS